MKFLKRLACFFLGHTAGEAYPGRLFMSTGVLNDKPVFHMRMCGRCKGVYVDHI